jgi:hypothetical protein
MFAHVKEDGTVDHRGSLPKNWQNVSGLNKSAEDLSFLQSLNWLPYSEVVVELGANDVRDGEDLVVAADAVTSTQLKRTMTDDEIADRLAGQWENLRFERNNLLTETDWMAASDRTMSSAETAYRQALRDLPANTSNPANPGWHIKPE